MITFREATEADVPSVVALLQDDHLGARREGAAPGDYLAAFRRMAAEGGNQVIVGTDRSGGIIATYQITFISGLSLRAARRAQLESVRVASDRRGDGVGTLLIADAEARARAAGCTLLQLTMNVSRDDARRFYERVGLQPTHLGFKKPLV
jgi:GNAT superfamily N-acetyltransferase